MLRGVFACSGANRVQQGGKIDQTEGVCKRAIV
jgi:hypothetical protein